MEFIDKHKAFIITSMLMSIFVLTLYNINMVKKKREQAEIMMEIPEEIMEELLNSEEEELPIPEEQNQLIAAAKTTHRAFNEDFEDIDDFEQRFKSLTEPTTTDEATPTDMDQLVQGDGEINESITEEEEIVSENKEETTPTDTETNDRNSTSTFELKDRKLVGLLPNPVYTCNGSGKVVVKIEVNENGYVIDSKIDKRNSTTRNECLFENAMTYAEQALFSAAELKNQKGSITYYFNYGG